MTPRDPMTRCDECGSLYIARMSEMASLCPECAFLLYASPKCDHAFEDGRCQRCGWDGSRSPFTTRLAAGS